MAHLDRCEGTLVRSLVIVQTWQAAASGRADRDWPADKARDSVAQLQL